MSDVVKKGSDDSSATVMSQVTDSPTIPDVDNYVAYTIKNTKALPPVTWSNLLNELNWLSVYILTIPPLVGIVGAFYVKLQWETAVWAVAYYFLTGLGTYPFAPSLFSL